MKGKEAKESEKKHMTAEQNLEVIDLALLEEVWGAGGSDSYSGLTCETIIERLELM